MSKWRFAGLLLSLLMPLAVCCTRTDASAGLGPFAHRSGTIAHGVPDVGNRPQPIDGRRESNPLAGELSDSGGSPSAPAAPLGHAPGLGFSDGRDRSAFGGRR